MNSGKFWDKYDFNGFNKNSKFSNCNKQDKCEINHFQDTPKAKTIDIQEYRSLMSSSPFLYIYGVNLIIK